jgi:hypothetical protein
MAIELHTVEVLDGSNIQANDRLILGNFQDVVNGAGAGAGQAVTVAVAFSKPITANYSVLVNPQQDATWFVSGMTAAGFNVTLTPRLAANTLAAGHFDVVVVG